MTYSSFSPAVSRQLWLAHQRGNQLRASKASRVDEGHSAQRRGLSAALPGWAVSAAGPYNGGQLSWRLHPRLSQSHQALQSKSTEVFRDATVAQLPPVVYEAVPHGVEQAEILDESICQPRAVITRRAPKICDDAVS